MGELQFYPFTSLVETSFWDLLIKNKINVYKMNNEPIDLVASYRIGKSLFEESSNSQTILIFDLIQI